MPSPLPHLAILPLTFAVACLGPNAGERGSGREDTGCGDEVTVEVGTGDEVYTPLSPGDPVTMVHGPQGGWHILGSARVQNSAEIVTLRYTIHTLDGGVLIADNTYRVLLVDEPPCGGSFPGMYAYLNVAALAEGDNDTPPELLADAPLRMRIEATDDAGASGVGEIEVIAALDPIDQP
ncbi:hypothetical protein L6R49_28455 [Myxococcota bacterium]|nr:hypothetical protein [Myxococcota bacterium]